MFYNLIISVYTNFLFYKAFFIYTVKLSGLNLYNIKIANYVRQGEGNINKTDFQFILLKVIL
jgi:hypothetical protein